MPRTWEPNPSIQACHDRVRVNLPPARNFLCVDCGKPATDYDHYLGYNDEHCLDVQPVCRSCHFRREIQRGKHPRLTLRIGPKLKDGHFLSWNARKFKLNRGFKRI